MRDDYNPTYFFIAFFILIFLFVWAGWDHYNAARIMAGYFILVLFWMFVFPCINILFILGDSPHYRLGGSYDLKIRKRLEKLGISKWRPGYSEYGIPFTDQRKFYELTELFNGAYYAYEKVTQNDVDELFYYIKRLRRPKKGVDLGKWDIDYRDSKRRYLLAMWHHKKVVIPIFLLEYIVSLFVVTFYIGMWEIERTKDFIELMAKIVSDTFS